MVGASGSGKTTICKELYRKYGLNSIESYTTRSPRYENEEGHIFIEDYEADEILQTEEIVGYTEFNNNKYFATALQVQENQIYVIDVDGVEYFDEHYTGLKNVIMVYVDVDEETRYKRMVCSRGEQSAKERIEYDAIVFKNAPYMADYIVENYDIDEAVECVYQIWKKGK
ncbi:MAG: AAA family ATPase [Prevotellaceae bacterium]|nr:AAA family ATPase [Candidatus Colivivens equi]